VHKGGIAVNARGIRYVDESQSFKKLAAPSLAQPAHITYQIFDQTAFDLGDDKNPHFTFNSRLNVGDIVKADTLDELAEMLGIPAKSLKNTIQRYNEGVAEGEDPDFGRTSLVDGKGALAPIERAPFYGHATTVAMLGTYCGLKTDGALNVVDVFEEPIEGLYAAGEVLGGFHGHGEIPGAALGKAIIFGRVAAMNVAALGNDT
jgi:fumarate reductase flavoprotein subunit